MANKEELVEYLYNVADRYGIDRAVAYAQIDQESRFNPNAQSSAGAKGIAQFISTTGTRYGLTDPFDPYASLEAWGLYMSDLLTMFGYDRYDLALAGYNSGENRDEYKAAAREGRSINWSVLPSRVQSETRNYVNTILTNAGQDPNVVTSPPIIAPIPDPNPMPPSENTLIYILAGAGILLALILFKD
jgi:soluble lytic murein transglycosylase-like protein